MPDRQINISVGNSRNSKAWRQENTTVSALYTRLSQPIVSTETHAEYMGMSKAQQDELKDVGGFVGGTLNGTRRKAMNVTGRDIITLDFDNIPGWQSDAVTAKVEALRCSYCIYSTRKHTPAKPRLRIIIPLDRTASTDEYEPIARRLAQQIGIEMADKTTFDVSRLMYWPSKCSDTEYYFKFKDAPFISADMVLGTYADWRDMSAWPQVPGAVSHKTLAVKQGDPLEKLGTVGAFCRTYTIEQAMDTFLPGIYEAVDGMPDRYTYLGGSTTGGAIVYDDKFLYSHHATDPCGEKLVNAFDMVRLHKFGDLDEDKSPDTPITKMPSFLKMCEFAEADKGCRATLNRERQSAAAADFANALTAANGTATTAGAGTSAGTSGTATQVNGGVIDTEVEGADWRDDLEYKVNSDILKNTINNYLIVLNNDPLLKDKFAFNAFAERKEIFGALPWDNSTQRRMWTDADTNGLYWFMEAHYNQAGRGNIDSALSLYMAQHSFNEVQDFLNGLQWDGVKRLDTLFIDYLGAEDTAYTRAVTRKMFVAGVARAMTPGVKFDNMLILVGSQGLGKSTLLRRMAKGWFNDSICSFEGKDAAELLQGVWLVEISELGAFRKSESSRIKQFLSLNSDIFRAAYARNAEERQRKCVFFGSTNDDEFLRDPTGERRFWPVDCDRDRKTKSPFTDLTDAVITQIWAEARAYWVAGEPLFLNEALEQLARDKQMEHKEESGKEGIIREFISRLVPEDWQKYTLDQRRMWWGSASTGAGGTATQESTSAVDGNGTVKLVERDRVSAVEIWVECFNADPKYMKQADVREINAVFKSVDGWSGATKSMKCGPYGQQRCHMRIGLPSLSIPQ